jgi:integrase/recombinase XerD
MQYVQFRSWIRPDLWGNISTGARAQEVVDLKVSDIKFEQLGQVRIVGKGRKQRTCPLWKETTEAIKQSIDQRNDNNQQSPLFLNAKGNKFTRFGIRYIVKKYGKLAAEKEPSIGKKKIGPHTIRHSTAMHLLKSGNEINMVGIWLGHASINTTHAYLEIDLEMKKKMLDKMSPPINSEPSECLWKQDKVMAWIDSLIRPNNYVK